MSTNSQFDEHHDGGSSQYYRDLLANEPGNPDHVQAPWEEVGVDKPQVDHSVFIENGKEGFEVDKSFYDEAMEVF